MIDVDCESRERIKTDLATNFFVEAGAGSGKTTMLVARMVAMVEAGIDIDKLCAITFTKAAAGEFYARFQKELSKSNTQAARSALKKIDLCFMGTIDSFCNMVLSEHPVAAGIPSNASVISDDELNALCLSMYSKIQKGEKGSEIQKKCNAFRLHNKNPYKAFLEGIQVFLRTKNVHYHFQVPPIPNCDELFSKEKVGVLRVLNYLREHPEIVQISNAQDRTAWAALNDNISLLTGPWNEKLDDVMDKLNSISNIRLVAKYKGSVGDPCPEFEEFFVLNEAKRAPTYEANPTADPFLTQRLDRFRYGIAMDFLVCAAKIISEDLKLAGKLTYTDYLLYLRDLLKKDASEGGRLIAHIAQRHRYFLVDEFQDTNPIQAEILFYLTDREPHVDWKDCTPRPGSLFIVGDPKQSIYRFNNADVGAFLRVKNLFVGEAGEVLYLSKNFRSCEPLCRWFNHVFSSLMPTDTLTQSRFNKIPLDDKPAYKATFSGVYRYPVAYASGIKSSDDPESVAQIIERIIADPNLTIQDNKTGAPPRRPEYKDIMVITWGKSNLSYYMNAFQKHHIPFVVEGAGLFQDCPALIALTYLMEVIADPFDRKAQFAAEKCSGCALSYEDSLQYANRAKLLSPAGLFTMLLEEQRIFSRVSSRNAECVFFALELLRAAEINGEISSIKEAVGYLNTLIYGNSNQERGLHFDLGSNCVHIANLHKVKGLEAPIVILAEPLSKKHAPEKRIDYESNPPQGWIFSLNRAKPYDYFAEQDLEQAAMDEERIRLLYVASTRACNALIIAHAEGKSGPTKSNPWYQLAEHTLEDIRKQIAPYTPTATPQTPLNAEALYQKAEETSVLNSSTSACPTYTVKRPSSTKVKRTTVSKEEPQEYLDSEHLEQSPTPAPKRNAALIGTMVHRLMECLVSSKNKVNLEPLVSEIVRDYDADDAYYRGILRKVGNTMRSGGYPQENGVSQDLLWELLSADQVYCEVPFCFQGEDSCIWNGVMDVIYLKNGRWHILDYKTNADPSDLDEQYNQQLSAYIQAFKNIMQEDADALIYHIEV